MTQYIVYKLCKRAKMTSPFLDAVLSLFDPGFPYLGTSEKTMGELALFQLRATQPQRKPGHEAMLCYVAMTEFRWPVGLPKVFPIPNLPPS